MDSLHISSMVPHETPEDLQWGGAAGVDEQWSDWSDEEAGEGSAVQMAKEAKEKMKLVGTAARHTPQDRRRPHALLHAPSHL